MMIKRILGILLSGTLVVSCANIAAPNGGPPDTTPPTVLETTPKQKTINFAGDQVTIEWSKYMDRAKVIENLSIMPTVKYSYDWSGKDLQIDFEEPLRENTSYSILFGTDYTDNKQNKPQEAFSLIFSTGSVLDSGVIRGTLRDAQPAGSYVFAYNLDGINPDTLNPFTTAPNYKVQIGSNGHFEINALKDGKYRVMAVRDQLRDGMLNDNQDGYGSALFDPEVVSGKSRNVEIRSKQNIDFTAPKVFSALAESMRTVIVQFSEAMDSTSFRKEMFVVKDSITSEIKEIAAVFANTANNNSAILKMKQSLSPSTKYKLEINTIEGQPRDTSGNAIEASASNVVFTSPKTAGEEKFEIVRTSIKDSLRAQAMLPSYEFVFTDALADSIDFSKVFVLNSPGDTNKINLEIKRISENKISVAPVAPLKNLSWYRLSFNTNFIENKYAEPMKLGSLKYDFMVEDNLVKSIVSGKVIDSIGFDKPMWVILKSKDGKTTFRTKANADGTWKFDAVPQGVYTADVLIDLNDNGIFDKGNPYPFTFAEPYFEANLDINVKPRWNTEGVNIKVKD